ncbi:subtilisin-like protein [Athelia psychrophila]|uniref:Subtilisin-like protein n=1 Tax=Athelia psychrophila TaxID=1759441 RepID=A0A166TBY0_9AGAM|nr:subtilisin-like protein [Fibularhizoctonia sp. CBS 109695]
MISTVSVTALVQVCLSKELSKRWDDLPVKHSGAAEHTINLRVGLKQDKLDELIASLCEVSEPEYPKYGQHSSVEEINAPWPTHNGVYTVSAVRTFSKDWVSMSVSVAQTEAMLAACIPLTFISPGANIPIELHFHIDVVAPTTNFPSTRSMRANSFRMKGLQSVEGSNDAVQYTCKQVIQPSCLYTLCNTTGYTPKSAGKNKIAVAGYLERYANHEYLQTVTKALGHSYNTDIMEAKTPYLYLEVRIYFDFLWALLTLVSDEANLDVQYVSSMAFPTPFTYYSTGGSPPFKPDAAIPTNSNERLTSLLLPALSDDERSVPYGYATHVCDGFGARGVSILFFSGDFGVGASTCKTNDGKGKTQFQPAFPASCPNLTAIGATTCLSPEVAANFSGGGFSNCFAAPSQKTVTAEFVKSLGTKYSGLYNKTSRGHPDISAQGEEFLVIIGNQTGFIGGTSRA